MTLARWQHVGGFGLAVAGTGFAAAFGGRRAVVVAYLLALALGAVLYVQGEAFAAVGPVFGNALVGYLAGVVGSLGLATGLFVWLLDAPVDYAAWQVGLMLWDSWAGVGVAVISGFFLTGLADLLR